MRGTLLILMLVMNLFWAASYVVFKKLSLYLDAGLVVTFRYGLAAILLLAIWPWLPGRAPRGRDLWRTAFMGVVVFVAAGRLQVAGVHLGNVADASVLIALEPLITSLAAACFLGERLPPRRWIGFALGLSGVVLLSEVWRPGFRLPGLAANALILASYVCETPWSVMGKILIQRASLLKVVTVALTAGSLVNLSLDNTAVFEAIQRMPLSAWVLLLYLSSICTVLGYSLWYVVIREADVNVTALTLFIQPVFSMALAIVLLGDPLHRGQLWGSIAIVFGLVIGLPRRSRPMAVATAAVIAISAPLSMAGAEAISPISKPVLLFDGASLKNWDTWLVDTKRNDPRNVFAVTNGQIRISGDGLGYLATVDTYRNYHLIVEYRWGTRSWRWGQRENKARDSGVFLHSFGPDGNSHDGQGAFKAAIECNIFQGATGDFLVIRGTDEGGSLLSPKLTTRVRPERDGEGWYYYDPEGMERTLERWGRINWRNKSTEWRDRLDFRGPLDVESPGQEWTRLECICDKDQIRVLVNGVIVNQATSVSPSEGAILLQCEGSEIFFRRVELWPLGKMSEGSK